MDFAFGRKTANTAKNAFETQMFAVESGGDTFSLQSSQVLPNELAALCSVLERTSTVKKVEFNACQLGGSSAIKALMASVKKNSSLSSLGFSHCEIGDEGVKEVATVVQMKHSLLELSFEKCSLTELCADSLKKMLEFNKNLKSINMSENPLLGEKGIVLLLQGILETPFEDASQLQALLLKDVSLNDQVCKLLGAVLANVGSLKRIDVSHNQITKVGAKFLAHGMLKRVAALEMFNISNNLLGDEGVVAVAKKLKSIEFLNLDNVGMKAAGFEKLCAAVKSTDTVQELVVSNNALESDSFANLAMEMLNSCSTLASFDLSGVKLSTQDVKLIGEFLRNPIRCRLKTLKLANCNISNDNVLYLAAGLRDNTELEVLDVTSNPFGAKGAKSFAKVFKRFKTLKTFKVTGSRIGAEGENYLCDAVRCNKNLEILGTAREMDYLHRFAKNKGAFELNADGEIIGWSDEAWEVVKRGVGQAIAVAILALSKAEFKKFLSDKIIKKSKNVVNQNMFEYVLRHAVTPALEIVNIFVNKCRIRLDSSCGSRASSAMAKEYRKSDDVTYRAIASSYAKDPMVKAMAQNNRLFLGRYLTENGPAIHETHELIRFLAKDTSASGQEREKKIFVQIYENEFDFQREITARDDMKDQLNAAGPFAIYDTMLQEIEVHEDNSVVSFKSSLTDLRHCVNNLGVTAGYNLHETIFLVKRAAQCLGTVNNLGRIHGDFRPRNFVKVAHKRMGRDPVGRTNQEVQLPDKWVLFDFSKSVGHGEYVELRMDSSYLPPEIARITFNKNYSEKQLPRASEKTDVWAFGVVLFQLLTGVHLFHVETNTDRIFRSKERLELMNWINLDENRQKLIMHRANESIFQNETSFNKIKQAAVDLVSWCLQGDPYNRPSFNEILKHPFFVMKTHVNYTDIDLLLGWYKKIGSDMSAASHKNNRTHFHVINAVSKESADAFTTLQLLFNKVGCKVSNDAHDKNLDIQERKDKVQKAKALVVLLEKDVFWRTEIIQKLLWAMDSVETNNLILLDISSAHTGAEKFDFDAYQAELQTPEGKKKLQHLVKTLTPIEKKLNLTQIPYEKQKSKKWLERYILEEVNEYIVSLKEKIILYRTRDFLSEAMVDEMLARSGYVSAMNLRKFDLFNNQKTLFDGADDEEKKEAPQKKVKILVLYKESDGLRIDAANLRKNLLHLETGEMDVDVSLVSEPSDVLRHFSLKEGDKGGRILEASVQTLALCLVSQGFYEGFREPLQLLDSARGLVSVVPIAYNEFDVTNQAAKDEVMNLGLDSKEVLERLKDQRTYIPLPATSGERKYESEAAMKFIVDESRKVISLCKENKDKSENYAYTKYTNTNFREVVY